MKKKGSFENIWKKRFHIDETTIWPKIIILFMDQNYCQIWEEIKGVAKKYVFTDTFGQFAISSSTMKDWNLICNKQERLSINCNIVFLKKCHVRQKYYQKRISVEHAT